MQINGDPTQDRRIHNPAKPPGDFEDAIVVTGHANPFSGTAPAARDAKQCGHDRNIPYRKLPIISAGNHIISRWYLVDMAEKMFINHYDFRRRIWPPFIIAALLLSSGCAAAPSTSEWVHPGADGTLVYKTTPAGDRIMDFSYAGYMGGGVALPDVPVKETVQPSGSADDTAAIQAAIDRVSMMPLVEGFRGAVLLGPGTFNCAQPLTISASGVVLRGSGQGPAGTVSTIHMTGKPHIAITVRRSGGGRGGRRENPETEPSDSPGGDQTHITDAYVPSGAISFDVADPAHFAVGDWITIHRPVTKAWVNFMHMNDLVRGGKPQTWLSPRAVLFTQRTITAINGHTLTLDIPLSDSLDGRYLTPPGVTVVKTPPPAELSQIGIEFLHIQCRPQEINHVQPHFVAIRLDGQDCWMRDTLIDDTMDSVGVNGA